MTGLLAYSNLSTMSRPRFLPDNFTLLLIAVVIVATVLPCRGAWAQVFHGITTVSIGLLFFMHGAAVSLEAFDVPLATADPGWNDV